MTYATAKATDWTQTLTIDAVGNAKTVVAGEVFTIANVYACNPLTKARLPYLQQFVVITGGTSAASGSASAQDLSLTISPPIITSGAYQTVGARARPRRLPTMTRPFSGWATIRSRRRLRRPTASARSSAGSPGLVSAKLIMPYSGEADFATDPDTGLTVRYWRTSDGINDTHLHRFDVIYGVKNVDRAVACVSAAPKPTATLTEAG